MKGYMYIYETRTPKHNEVEHELCTRKRRNGIVGKIFPDQRLVDFLGVTYPRICPALAKYS